MKNKFHYTRGYCPISREQRNFIFYIKIQKNILNKLLLNRNQKFFLFNFFFTFLFSKITLFILEFFKYQNIHSFLFGIYNSIFVIFFINFLFFLIFKDWKILQKLTKECLTKYEDVGFFEGRIWKKPVLALIQDNLILSYRIKPILIKIKLRILLYNLLNFIFLFSITWLN